MRKVLESLLRPSSEPLVLPRWMLYVLYALFVILGVVLAITGSPSIDLTTPEGYLRPYGIAIAVTAFIAFIAAHFEDHPLPECIAALAIFAFLTVYIASTVVPWIGGDTAKGALGVVVTIAALLPLFRGGVMAVGMIRRTHA